MSSLSNEVVNFQNAVRERARRVHDNASELSRQLGVTRNTIRQWLAKSNTSPLKRLPSEEKVARVLGELRLPADVLGENPNDFSQRLVLGAKRTSLETFHFASLFPTVSDRCQDHVLEGEFTGYSIYMSDPKKAVVTRCVIRAPKEDSAHLTFTERFREPNGGEIEGAGIVTVANQRVWLIGSHRPPYRVDPYVIALSFGVPKSAPVLALHGLVLTIEDGEPQRPTAARISFYRRRDDMPAFDHEIGTYPAAALSRQIVQRLRVSETQNYLRSWIESAS